MNDITEQRTMTETFAPQADSELHKIPVTWMIIRRLCRMFISRKFQSKTWFRTRIINGICRRRVLRKRQKTSICFKSIPYSVVFEKTSSHSSKGNDYPCDIKLS